MSILVSGGGVVGFTCSGMLGGVGEGGRRSEKSTISDLVPE